METKAAGSLTHGRLGKQILAFSLPLMLSNVLQVLFNMSDIAVVGRFSGPIALGAVGSTATLVTLFTGFLIGLGSGINALVARFLGAGSREETQRTVHTALALSLIFGAVLLLLGELTAVPLLKLLGTKEELIDGATIYLRIYFLGMPAMALYNFGNAVLSAAGDTRRPLLYLLIAGILNVALNLFFVIVCGMSADGEDDQYFTAAVIGSVILAALAWVGLILFERPLLMFFGTDETLLALAQRYMIPVKVVFPLFLFNQMLAAFLRNDGAPALATLGVLSGGIFNVFGDWFFVFPCDMGVYGAGLATALGSAVSFLVMLTHFASRKNTLRLVKPKRLARKSRLTKRGYRRIIMVEF